MDKILTTKEKIVKIQNLQESFSTHIAAAHRDIKEASELSGQIITQYGCRIICDGEPYKFDTKGILYDDDLLRGNVNWLFPDTAIKIIDE